MRRPLLLTSLALVASVGPLATAAHAADGATVTSARFVSGAHVIVTSSISCPAGGFYSLSLEVRQVRGRHQAVAHGVSTGFCTGTAQTVTTDVENSGPVALRRGKATVTPFAYATVCDEREDFCPTVLLADGPTTALRLR